MKTLLASALFALTFVSAGYESSDSYVRDVADWVGPYRLSSVDGQASPAALVEDQDGVVHAFWSESGLIGDERSVIQYSQFDGQTWSPPVDIYASWPGRQVSSVSAFVDDFGVVHLAWSEGIRGPLYYSSAPLEAVGSAVGWQQPLSLDRPGSQVDLSVDKQGVIHVAYLTMEGEEPGIHYIRSSTRGDSWEDPIWVDEDIPTSAIPAQFQLEVDDLGGVHLLWAYTAADTPGFPGRWIRYSHSLDSGSSWSSPRAIDTADGTDNKLRVGSPLMVIRGSAVHIIWASDTKTRRSHIYSVDRGLTWNNTERIFGEFHGTAGDDLVSDRDGSLHFVGQIRWSQGIYHSIWSGGGWSDPDLIYLIRAAAEDAFGDRVHAHNLRAAFGMENQLVITFTNEPGGSQSILYGMHQISNAKREPPEIVAGPGEEQIDASATADPLAEVPQVENSQQRLGGSAGDSGERTSSSVANILSVATIPALLFIVVAAATTVMRRGT